MIAQGQKPDDRRVDDAAMGRYDTQLTWMRQRYVVERVLGPIQQIDPALAPR
jgi:hypothetical protein